jgi:hypothetical protein
MVVTKSLRIPRDLHQQLTTLAHRRSIALGKNVTWSQIVIDMVKGHLSKDMK